MEQYFTKIVAQISEFLQTLSGPKKVAVVAVFIGIVVGFVLLFLWAGKTSFITLMSNLTPEDSTNIIRILREKHIPFVVDPSGKNISIPPENIYELRLELATMGLPQTSVVGYEIFDKQTLGTPSFVQKVNQKRAQEGELVRTINTIRGVRRSRVHLAIPSKSAFLEDQKKSTASVIIDLEPGFKLSDKQVYGIGNLVGRAIEGLDINDVVIVNSEGKVLSKNASDALSAATATQLEYQEKVEKDLEKRVESMLSRVVGEGHVVARVTADLDFSQINETQTVYDQDGAAVRTVEKRSDSMNGLRPSPYSGAGSTSNSPGQTSPTAGEVKTETVKNNEVTSYEVPQTVRKTTRSVGSIKKLSVAVIVDGKTVKTEQDNKVITKVESWPPEKLVELETIVAEAVGLDRKRGDTLDIKNIEFTREDFDETERIIAEQDFKDYVRHVVAYIVIGIAVLLFFFMVVKPFVKWITDNTIDSVDTFLPQTLEELERMQKGSSLPALEELVPVLPENIDPAKVEGEMIKEKIITLVESNPHKAALILRDWLHNEAKKKMADRLIPEEKAKSA